MTSYNPALPSMPPPPHSLGARPLCGCSLHPLETVYLLTPFSWHSEQSAAGRRPAFSTWPRPAPHMIPL